jgi:hypothetical protein
VEREKNMKKSLTQSELFEEIKDILDDVVNPVDTVIEIPDDEEITKAYKNCGCETCKAKNISCENCEDCISKSYESDDEEDDKWDNLAKACWSGYKQEGMKEKNGRMVPNCVPVNKAHHEEDMDKAKGKYEDVIGSRKGEPADKELYARVVAEAKRKFDTYPSAYANGWVVQEYKRRGGKYKVEKSIWGGAFIK